MSLKMVLNSPFPMVSSDLAYELTVARFVSIQSQAQSLSIYRIKFNLFLLLSFYSLVKGNLK